MTYIDWDARIRTIQDGYLCQYLDTFMDLEKVLNESDNSDIINEEKVIADALEQAKKDAMDTAVKKALRSFLGVDDEGNWPHNSMFYSQYGGDIIFDLMVTRIKDQLYEQTQE